MRTFLLSAVLLLSIIQSVSAKGKEDDSVDRFQLIVIPVVYYAPETRAVFGIAGSLTFRFPRDSAAAKPSNVILSAAYTQNKQWLFYLPYSIFYDNDKWYAFGEFGYYKYNYFFYGIGQQEVPEELYDVNYPRIKMTFTRRIFPHIYAGLRYQFEDFDIVHVQPAGALANGTIPGSNGSLTSGAGIVGIYDSRDTVFFPHKGFYAEVSATNNGRTWGGNFNFTKYIADIAYYQAVGKKSVLALNSYNSFVTGNAPFQQQSLLGGSKRMRGYYEGRFIDKNYAALQSEFRFPVVWRFGAAVFGGVAELGNEAEFLRFGDVKYSYGAGIRFVFNRDNHLNLRIDYARGDGTDGIYFTIGEAF